ncbi:hypothetical protein D3C86_1312290 [compost metagenome]
MLGLIVDVLEQGVFDGQHTFLAETRDITLAGRQQHRQRVLLVDRHQLVAQFIVRRMQRQRQGHIDDLAELVDHRHHARGGQGHLAFGYAIAEVVHHDLHGGDHVVEVQQRLAHAHHHHIGDGAIDLGRHATERLVGDPHLTDHFGGRQIAIETLLARGAEAAIQGATRLRRDTQGAARTLRDIHGFHTTARRHPHYPLARAIGGNIFADHFRAADFSAGLELLAQDLADVAHGIEIIDAKVVNPLHQLTGTETLFPDVLEELFHFCLGQTQ